MGSGHEEFSLFGVSLKQQCLIVKAFFLGIPDILFFIISMYQTLYFVTLRTDSF